MWQRAGYNLRNINVIRHNPILVHRLVGPMTHDTDCMQQQFFTMNLLIMLLLLFLTFSVLVANPKKTTLYGGQSRSWSAEQGKENKRKSLAAYPPPRPPHCLFGENKRGSKTSQACYSHPRCNLDLVPLFRFSLPLPVFGRPFSSSPHPPTRS